MPSSRPCAAFEPISPDFNLDALVESTPNLEYAVRIDSNMIDHHGLAAFERLILVHVILGGKPLVVEGYETKLDRWIFAIQWLRDNQGTKVENARDLTKGVNVPMTIGHYLKHMPLLTNQWTSQNYKDPERQRVYLKDIDCPPMWHERVKEHIPAFLTYLNESTGEIGGLGAAEEPDLNGSGTKKGRGIAKAGDLMSSLPKEMRADNLMCYIGHEGTYTPAHKEMCASLGHNIMVEASTGATENGSSTSAGSSIWFMTESKEREVVSEYWLSRLGHNIEVEKHFAQVNAWRNAPFKVYVVDQKPGDFVLIPPLAPHQVWNRGTRTMKIAWNRTTVETLEMAMNEALPKARIVCRDEQYKNKAIIYYSMVKYSKLLQQAEKIKQKNPQSKRVEKADSQIRQLQKDFKRLHILYTRILMSESFYPDRPEKKVEMVPFEGYVTCSYCRCNIFNRFLTCPSCVEDLPDGDKNTYDVCLDCYAMGRSCACISKLKWAKQWKWSDLIQKHEQWRHQIIQYEGVVNEKSSRSLKHELEKLGKQRTLAQICQTELIKRPWRDITKPDPVVNPNDGVDEEIQVDDNGNVKKKKIKKKSEKFMRDHGRCHTDCYWEPRWKQAQCTKCQKNYCYGILFRAYDMMPQDIMSNPHWECPSCLNICGCRNCRKKRGYRQYTPKGTLLGHNTKLVADPRSVESLVDFSFSNMQWIQKANDDDDAEQTRRMRKRQREAAAAMDQDPELGDDYVDEVDNQNVEDRILQLAQQEGIGINIPIDPELGVVGDESGDDDVLDENPEQLTVPFRHIRNQDQTQFSIPDGGIVQDPHHAYDQTDAITFIYPEPGQMQIPPPPTEVYQEAAEAEQSQYADPPSPSQIEMVERKRKRAKVDEGDRAFGTPAKSKVMKKVQPKKRQSLVVKLSANKDKLREIFETTSITQTALAGLTAIPAPVVSSDLQALDIESPNSDGQPPQKRVRVEAPIQVDRDDEYAPSKSRDRRKMPIDGSPLPPHPDNNIGRRTTRLHHVTYAEPDEDEFNEIVMPKSKRETMKNAEIDASDDDDAELGQSPQGATSGKRPALTLPATSIAKEMLGVVPRRGILKPTTTNNDGGSSSSRPGTASSNSALDTQASANRRAKLAIMEMTDINDIDPEEPTWSPDVSNANSPVLPDLSDEETPESTKDRPHQNLVGAPPAKISTSTVQHQVISKPTTITMKSRSGPAITASSSARPLIKAMPSIVQSNVSPASRIRASADDWADSDSDDDDIPYRNNNTNTYQRGGFVPINRLHN